MITEQILKEASQGDKRALVNIPKTDLHSHSVLACEKELFRELIGESFSVPEHFGSLSNFLSWVGTIIGPVIGFRDLAIVTLTSACQAMKRDGVTDAEISVHLPLAQLRGTNWGELAPLLKECIEKAGVNVSLELGIPRPTPDDFLRKESFEALESGVFQGIDIYDDELVCSLERFQPVIERARKLGCYVKIHSGEVGDPKSIWDDIRRAEPDAIQHGVRAAEDKRLITFLAAEKIPLHICPTSNVKLGVVKSIAEHPIRKLFDGGVTVTVNTDDYMPFGSSVSDEFVVLYKSNLFDAKELELIRQNGFQCLQSKA